MHKKVYKEFEKICAEKKVNGSVLEVGAVPNDTSLLCMQSLKNANEKIGINLEGPFQYKDFHILKGNANSMDCFGDNKFDAVLCNATLEHDKYFWKTISEIKRVAKGGGLIIIGAPGYDILPHESRIHVIFRYFPLLSKTFLANSAPTLMVHNYPGDYYRFSRQTFEEVFFAGMEEVKIRSVLIPPRLIGSGIKP